MKQRFMDYAFTWIAKLAYKKMLKFNICKFQNKKPNFNL